MGFLSLPFWFFFFLPSLGYLFGINFIILCQLFMEYLMLFKSLDSSLFHSCQFFLNFIFFYFLLYIVSFQENQLYICCLSFFCLSKVFFFLDTFFLNFIIGIILGLQKCCMITRWSEAVSISFQIWRLDILHKTSEQWVELKQGNDLVFSFRLFLLALE